IDLHARPQLLGNHKALLSLGHDEYWSAEMRDGAAQAVARGVNLAFLGANACYRQIRMEPSSSGPNRQQVCYKSAAEDPMTGQNDAVVTVNWPDAPVSRPESQLIGSTYQDVQASADMVIADPSSWALEGVGLVANQILPKAVEGEFDRYVPAGAGPANLDVIAHSVVPNRHDNYSDVTWYTVPGGGGVFATGNASWIGQLSDSPLIPDNVLPSAVPGVTAPLLRIMENVYSVLGSGPASISNPSRGNWNTVYAAGSASVAAPNPTNSA
ncbi:MAG: N,N-dimethylformamidase beta subunit family domain-containing protein, partial [Acidimicrobiales bacterium]